MISSIVNTHICFTIILTKRQSSVNAVYLKKYLVGSPLIMWLDDYGCICAYYLLARLNLRKGSYFIMSGNNSQSAYRTLQNESHTLMGGAILWCIEMIPGISISRWKITPTHHALRPDRKGLYANLVLGVILWYFEIILGVFIWLQHNELYGLIDSECMHIPCHFMDKNIPCHFMDKNGESFDNKMRNLKLGTCRQSSTGFTQFFLMYGKEAKLPAHVTPSVEMPIVDEAPVTEIHDQSTAEEVQTRLQAINHPRDSIYHKVKISQEKQKRLYNSRNTLKHHFTIGDQVVKWNFWKRDGKGGKMTDSWLGPYTVQKLTNGGVVLKNQIGKPLKQEISFSDIKTFVSRSGDQSSNSVERSGGNLPNRDWFPELMLRQTEKDNIVNGNWLDDKTMDAAQSLIKQQFCTRTWYNLIILNSWKLWCDRGFLCADPPWQVKKSLADIGQCGWWCQSNGQFWIVVNIRHHQAVESPLCP